MTPLTAACTRPGFGKPAYKWFRATDKMPTYDEISDQEDPLVRVKLFHTVGRWTYFAYALTDYSGQLVMTGYCVSMLGPDCDEFGDMAVDDLDRDMWPLGLPPERDIHFEPLPLSELMKKINAGVHV